MNSEMIGNPTTMPWAFIFKRVDNVPRPSQLYEALSYLLIFVSSFIIYKNTLIKIGNGFILDMRSL
jgi:prolipoprotein diacylglyceryltransferase